MSDKVQLAFQIRFSLNQLSERNGQHEFEHLCRYLAKERVCSNILPGTGPVQAGGDQGRDFETYKTFLENKSLRDRTFIGLASEKALVFACTLEKALPSKIKKDVKTIRTVGAHVDMIYVFATKDLNVSKRHELQEWAQSEYSVKLEVFDGAAISEMLTDHDVYWIAERFLNMPSEMRPDPPQSTKDTDWYTTTLKRWQARQAEPQTFADFSEIKAAGRVALGGPNSEIPKERPDLPFWLALLEKLAIRTADFQQLRRKAVYELAVLRLRGLGNLRGKESELREYFSIIPNLEDANDLKDAQALISLIGVAEKKGLVGLQEPEITGWHKELRDRLSEKLKAARKLERWNEWCSLQDTRGHEKMIAHIWSGDDPKEMSLEPWLKLCENVDRAPMFPLDQFARGLTLLTHIFWENPDFEELTGKVEKHLASRFGQFRVAENCIERVKKLSQMGNRIAAIRQLHKAKIEWFAVETLENTLRALCWLSLQYQQLGLLFASKYYALSAAFISLHADGTDTKTFVAKGLDLAAYADYGLGFWSGYFRLEAMATASHLQFNSEFSEQLSDEGGFGTSLLFHISTIATVTKAFYPGLSDEANQQMAKLSKMLELEDVLQESLTLAEKSWHSNGWNSLWDAAEEQLYGVPWGDVGATRRTSWRAQGLTWNVQWYNDLLTTLAVEEFLAQLQVFLADVGDLDLCLLRSTIEMRCSVNKKLRGKPFSIRFEPSHAERLVVVELSSEDCGKEFRPEPVGLIACLLEHVSALPQAKLLAVLEARFKDGLPNKMLIGASYRTCLSEFVDEEPSQVSVECPRPREFISRTREAIPWESGPGPGYRPEEAAKGIEIRYQRFAKPIRQTLKMLGRSPAFLRVADKLHAEGWKNWHILAAVFHVTMNHRINALGLGSLEESRAASRSFFKQEETEQTELLPDSIYSEEELKFQFGIYAGSFLTNCGLEMHQETPDTQALLDFLGVRFNLWNDDFEAPDPFDREAVA